MGPPGGLRSPAPDPKPRGAAWKWGIAHAGHARSPKSTAAPSPWDLMQVNPPPPRDQSRINGHRPAHADDHRSGPQTPAGAAEHRSGPQTPAGAAEPDHASAPDPAKLDAERPQARAHERDRIYDDLGHAEWSQRAALVPQAVIGSRTGLGHSLAAAGIDRLRPRRPGGCVSGRHGSRDDRTTTGPRVAGRLRRLVPAGGAASFTPPQRSRSRPMPARSSHGPFVP